MRRSAEVAGLVAGLCENYQPTMRFHPALALALGVARCLCLCAAAAEPPSPRVLARYREMLQANPAEGTALDRLWKAHADAGTTAELLRSYTADTTFAGRMLLGLLQRRAGDDAAAAKAFAEATGLNPDSAQPHLALGRLFLDTGDPARAAESLGEAARRLTASGAGAVAPAQLTETLLALGSAWLAAGQVERAAEAWEKIAAATPENLDLRRRLADQYVKSGLAERAIPHLQYLGVHAPPPERPQALQRLATIHQSAGRADESIRVLEAALGLTSRGNWLRAELEGQLIRVYQRFGRTAELEARWKKYLAENPRDAGAYLQLAEFYHRLGDLEHERAAVEGLVRLLPKIAEYRLRLARLLARSDDFAAAAALYDELLRELPGNSDLVFERAELEIRQDRPQEAQQRVQALLAQRRSQARDADTLRAKALEFFREHRLLPEVEATLRQEAESGTPEGLSALSQFLFSQHREQEAEQVLRRMIRPNDAPAVQAGKLLEISAALKQQNLLQPALKAAHEAAERAGQDTGRRREALLATGDLHLALGTHEAAREAVDEAARLSATPAETAEADQRLFEVLRQLGEKETARFARGPAGITAPGELQLSPAVSAYEVRLMERAQLEKKAESWLRLARWQSWCRNNRAAKQSVEEALAIDPKSVPVHEFAVKLVSSEAPILAAQPHLEKLAELDPANAAGYRRRLAQLELQAGQVGQALARLETLAQERPADPEVLTELATAQQAAERWDAALATWRRVHSLSPPARSRESLTPLLRIYERTGRHRGAAELLLAETEKRAEGKEKRELFADLLALCTKQGLLSWLRERWEEKRHRQPDDFFLETAYAEILKSDGDRAGAFETLSRALFTAPDPAAALPDLVRQAEDLRRFDAAIEFQSRLTRLGPQDRPEALKKLAELQEKDFDLAGAERTWEQVIRRFPRDPEVLHRAVDFFRRAGNANRAAALLRRVRALEGPNVNTAYQLAQLDLESARLTEAEQGLEEILRLPAPPTEGEPFIFPALKPGNAGRLQADYLAAVKQRRGRASPETMQSLRGFWVEAPSDGRSERDRRLGAIRDVASLIRARDNPAAIDQWIERWRRVDEDRANEALWAFYYAGATTPALDLLEKLIAGDPADESLQQGFIWVALQLGGFERLGAWNQDRKRTVKQRDFFRIALAQFLRAQGPQIPQGMMEGLYPPGARMRLWEGAELCAANGSYREAIALGERALETDGLLRNEHRLQIAHWLISLGDIEAGRKALVELARMPAEAYESPVFAAQRAAWLLLAPAQRRAFADRIEHDLGPTPTPVHAALTRLLLFGLQEDDKAAKAQIRQLLGMRVTIARPADDLGESGAPRLSPGGRTWSFILNTGLLLQVWKLEPLTEYLWEQALADRAMLRLEGEQAQELARDVRTSLFALKLARADRTRFDELLLEYSRGVQLLEGAVALGETLESMGAQPAARELFYRLWDKDPGNPQLLRNVLNVCRVLEDSETAEAVLTRCVTERLFAQNDNVQRDLVTQLADSLERRQAFPAAEKILTQAIELAPFDPRLLLRHAQLLERAGRTADAENAYRRLISTEPGHTAGRMGLAALLDAAGKPGPARGILQRNPPSGAETQLATICVKDGQVEEAAAIVERLVGPAYLNAVDAVATAMLAKGELKAARNLLQTAIARAPDSPSSVPLQQKIVESLEPQTPLPTLQRELRKLRRLAGDDPARLGLYFSVAQLTGLKFPAADFIRADLDAAWSEGAGMLEAGVVLLGWHLDTNMAAAEATLAQLLARRDLSAELLGRLTKPLLIAKRPDLAAKVQQRVVAVTPLEDGQVVNLIDYLEQAGQRPDAIAALEKWGARAPLSDEFAAKIAPLWVKLGHPERAEPLFAQVTGGTFGKAFEPYLAHARLRMAAGDLPAAKRLLREAYRFPAHRSFDDLLAWARAAGKLELPDEITGVFDFTPARARAWHAALFTAFEAAKEPQKAAALLAGHPESLLPGQAARLRGMATAAGAYAEAAGALQLLSAQSALADEITLELTHLLGAWADADSLAGRQEEALAHLTQAAELRPELWPVTEKLYKFLRGAGQAEKARIVLDRFVANTKNPAERDRAERLRKE
jgi:tetratricopeptide (TPR) repeat protein